MTHFWLPISISIVSALAYGFYFVHQPESLPRTLCKALAVGMLALFSLISHGPVLLTLALTLGTIGDVALSRRGDRAFLIGLGAFLMGHLAYVLLLYDFGVGGVLPTHTLGMVLVGVLVIAVAAILQRLWAHLGAMRLPVLAYSGVSLMLGLVAFGLPPVGPVLLIMAGAAAFITSDAILAFELFTPHQPESRSRAPATILWFLYWAGQALIVAGVMIILVLTAGYSQSH